MYLHPFAANGIKALGSILLFNYKKTLNKWKVILGKIKTWKIGAHAWTWNVFNPNHFSVCDCEVWTQYRWMNICSSIYYCHHQLSVQNTVNQLTLNNLSLTWCNANKSMNIKSGGSTCMWGWSGQEHLHSPKIYFIFSKKYI